MPNKIGIYIPSKGRSDRAWIKRGPLSSIPKSLRRTVTYVVSENEYDEYSNMLPSHVNLVSCPYDNNIGKVRQWILENAEHKYVLFSSDDLKFSKREGDKLLNVDKKMFVLMLDDIFEQLEKGYVHVGVSQRAFNRDDSKSYVINQRMNDFYAYNVKKVLKSGARFDRMPVMEDFDMTLTLLEKGYKNIILYKWAWAQRKSGDIGGCSSYRKSSVQASAARLLAQLHPGVVKIVEKESKVEWGGLGTKRTDVIISWKKAYRPRNKKPITSFFGA